MQGVKWTLRFLLGASCIIIGTTFSSLSQQHSNRLVTRAAMPITRRAGTSITSVTGSSVKLKVPQLLPTLTNQPLPMVEICATGQVSRYASTLTSIRGMLGASKLAADADTEHSICKPNISNVQLRSHIAAPTYPPPSDLPQDSPAPGSEGTCTRPSRKHRRHAWDQASPGRCVGSAWSDSFDPMTHRTHRGSGPAQL